MLSAKVEECCVPQAELLHWKQNQQTLLQPLSKGSAFTSNQSRPPLVDMTLPKLHCVNVSLWFLLSPPLVLVPPVKPLQTAGAMACPFVLPKSKMWSSLKSFRCKKLRLSHGHSNMQNNNGIWGTKKTWE